MSHIKGSTERGDEETQEITQKQTFNNKNQREYNVTLEMTIEHNGNRKTKYEHEHTRENYVKGSMWEGKQTQKGSMGVTLLPPPGRRVPRRNNSTGEGGVGALEAGAGLGQGRPQGQIR